MSRGFWLALVLLAWAPVARADEFVIAPPWYAAIATNGENISDKIAQAVEKELSKQYSVVSPAQAAERVAAADRVACHGGECAERYRDASHATAAIVIRVHREAEGKGPATSFQIGLQPTVGIEYRAGGVLAEGPLDELVRRTLGEVFHAYRRGPGPFLYVTGAPANAAVYLNEQLIGTAPRQFTLPIGSHKVRIEAPGYAPQEHLLVFSSVTTERKLEYSLAPASQVTPLTPQESDGQTPETRRTNWRRPTSLGLMIGGGAVLALGVTYAALAARNGRLEATCASDSSLCTRTWLTESETSGQRAGGIVLTLVGAAALATGLGIHLRDRKLQVGASVSANHAVWILRGTL